MIDRLGGGQAERNSWFNGVDVVIRVIRGLSITCRECVVDREIVTSVSGSSPFSFGNLGNIGKCVAGAIVDCWISRFYRDFVGYLTHSSGLWTAVDEAMACSLDSYPSIVASQVRQAVSHSRPKFGVSVGLQS